MAKKAKKVKTKRKIGRKVKFLKELFDFVVKEVGDATSTRQRKFDPVSDITVQELAYIYSNKIPDRMYTDEEFSGYDPSITRHFK